MLGENVAPTCGARRIIPVARNSSVHHVCNRPEHEEDPSRPDPVHLCCCGWTWKGDDRG